MGSGTKKAIAGCALPLLLAAGLLAWLSFKLDKAFQPNPPTSALPALVRDLPKDKAIADARRAFQRRVGEQFPNGTMSSTLAARLRQQGFKIFDNRKSNLMIASVSQYGPCRSDWSVSWTPDAQGRAQNIQSRYDVTCL